MCFSLEMEKRTQGEKTRKSTAKGSNPQRAVFASCQMGTFKSEEDGFTVPLSQKKKKS